MTEYTKEMDIGEIIKELARMRNELVSAEAVSIHEDGTLEVKVPNAQKVGRVLVIDTDSHIGGGLFYPDDTVPQSEQYKKGFEDAKRAFELEFAREAESLRKRNAQLEVLLNAQKAMAAEAAQGEWIQYSEKPPKEKQEVYVTVYFTEGDTGRAYGYIDRFGKWHLYSAVEGELNSGYKVTAWMPLPKPYKGGAK